MTAIAYPPPRRRWLKGVVVTAITVPLVIVVAFAALVGLWLSGVKVPFASGATWLKVEKLGHATFNGDFTQPVYILVVGNDGRPDIGGARGDALHVIGINPQLHQGSMIDIPRDTEVAIPGHGRDKINAAYAFGGVALQAQIVSQLIGINLQYAMTTNFAGFTSLVDELGGVDVDVKDKHTDVHFSGAVFDPGVQHMNGAQALAFNRDRHSFPTSDLKRSENQGTFILSALATLRARRPGITDVFGWLTTLMRHTQIEGIGVTELYQLGQLGLGMDPSTIKNVVLPVVSGHGSNLNLGASAQGLFADFRDDAVLETH
jgi:LCP family protein required for cell wall assembly